MRIRFHKETERTDENYGCILLEAEPQKRTLQTYLGKSIRLNLPYLYFLIKYKVIKLPNGSTIYEYGGLRHSALRISCASKKIKNIDQQIYLMPTEEGTQGQCCTNHAYDGELFKDVKSLVECIVSLWYGHKHWCNYDVYTGEHFNYSLANENFDSLKNKTDYKNMKLKISNHTYLSFIKSNLNETYGDSKYKLCDRKWK